MTYTKRFGADVAGLVFVDASHPDQIARLAVVAPKLEQSLTMAKVVAAPFLDRPGESGAPGIGRTGQGAG